MMRSFCWSALVVLSTSGTPAVAADFTPLPSFERVMSLAQPKSLPDFKLTDQRGSPRSLSDLQGKPVLVFFGFAHCPDVCPAAMTKLAALQKAEPQRMRDVHVVMISVDGERDTPQVMSDYLGKFSKDFIGLTGSPDAVRDIAARFSAVFFKDPPKKDTGEYLLQHTSRIYAIDRQGRLRAELYDASVESTAGVVKALLGEKRIVPRDFLSVTDGG